MENNQMQNKQQVVTKQNQQSKKESTGNEPKKTFNHNDRPRHNGPRRSSLGDNFEERIKIKRISKTTKGGRHMRFSALAIVGDHNGKVGYGIGKANETPNAIKKAIKNARKNLTKVEINKKGTLYHEILGRKGASKVLIKPAPEGTGIIAGSVIRDVLELAGYKDIYTKNLGSNSPLNMVTAVVEGLKHQHTPKQIFMARDIEISKTKNNSEVK